MVSVTTLRRLYSLSLWALMMPSQRRLSSITFRRDMRACRGEGAGRGRSAARRARRRRFGASGVEADPAGRFMGTTMAFGIAAVRDSRYRRRPALLGFEGLCAG